jgi:hypothetical protein
MAPSHCQHHRKLSTSPQTLNVTYLSRIGPVEVESHHGNPCDCRSEKYRALAGGTCQHHLQSGARVGIADDTSHNFWKVNPPPPTHWQPPLESTRNFGTSRARQHGMIGRWRDHRVNLASVELVASNLLPRRRIPCGMPLPTLSRPGGCYSTQRPRFPSRFKPEFKG